MAANTSKTVTVVETQKAVSGTNAKNNSGAVLRGQAAAASRTDASVSTTSSESHSQLAVFQQALSSCMGQFSHLGKWIQSQVEESMESLIDTMDLPKLYAEFKSLSPLMKVVVVIGLLALLALLRWMTWEAVSYIWPKLLEFINSEQGKSIMSSLTGFLTKLQDSSILHSFTKTFEQASVTKITEITEGDDEDVTEDSEVQPPCFDISLWENLKTETPSQNVVNIVDSLFKWLATRIMS